MINQQIRKIKDADFNSDHLVIQSDHFFISVGRKYKFEIIQNFFKNKLQEFLT